MSDYNVWQMLGVQYWGVRELKKILNNTGFGSDDIVDATYQGITKSGSLIFKVRYDDRAGEAGAGNVYVKPDNNGFLRAEY